ncbi:hypothetical protein F0P96_10480 [Hymenobacter busanensis]|uniref:Uncharacterized protein n=1 Tax=Hymenobacter busanensis TaxID=2607656 RepID=A0A7L4ZWR4_9BACT|nr:hypothetical protein [Hymenobacter busanensis]KAA9333386.1 hypothetical protein F0P96_10480 [Hymenobacter busanensis]QHJ07934.1 hypothetical protein GUY19_11825 [Hymenobacter busanensis]
MKLMKLTLEFTSEIELAYDEESPEFQEALASYRELATGDPDTTAREMVQHVAHQLREWGDHHRIIECVGYVGLLGSPTPAENYSGIQVGPDYAERWAL